MGSTHIAAIMGGFMAVYFYMKRKEKKENKK
jgi:hypothetical protein